MMMSWGESGEKVTRPMLGKQVGKEEYDIKTCSGIRAGGGNNMVIK